MKTQDEFRAYIAQQEAEREAFRQEIAAAMEARGGFKMQTDYGKVWLLSRNTDSRPDAAPYRITFFFDGKEPTGHIEVRSLTQAAQEMIGFRKKEDA